MARRVPGDAAFMAGLAAPGLMLAAAIAGLVVALLSAGSWSEVVRTIRTPEIAAAASLSLVTATLSMIVSLWIAVPTGYLLSRFTFRGKALLEILFDVPLVLPPLVVGLGLLMLFQWPTGQWLQRHVMPVTFQTPAIVIAQVTVVAALGVRAIRSIFDQIDRRPEEIACTLGSTRGQAFRMIALPQAGRGIAATATLLWARALGEFGPVLVFAGTTRFRTEVLPTSIYLELNSGNMAGAAAVSMLMLFIAAVILLLARRLGANE